MGVAGSLPGKGALLDPLVAQLVTREGNTPSDSSRRGALRWERRGREAERNGKGDKDDGGLGNLFKTRTARDIFTSQCNNK